MDAAEKFGGRTIKSDDVEGIEFCDWRITCRTKPILNSEELEALAKSLNMKILPEMVFGNNFLRLEHKSGFSYEFNAFQALQCVDNNSELPTVAFAKEWTSSKQATLESGDVKVDVVKYDWSFTTDYKGKSSHKEHIINNNNNDDTKAEHTDNEDPTRTTEKIDLEMLKRPDPIFFYKEIQLFEDELSDNGISSLSIKARVMPSCFFVLLRFWLRIDGVLFRIIDTRVFHEFKKNYLLRERQVKEGTFQSVAQMLPDPMKHLDSNLVGQMLKTKQSFTEKILVRQ